MIKLNIYSASGDCYPEGYLEGKLTLVSAVLLTKGAKRWLVSTGGHRKTSKPRAGSWK